LVASHHQIKNESLSAISLPAGRQGRLCGESKQFYALLNNTGSPSLSGLFSLENDEKGLDYEIL